MNLPHKPAALEQFTPEEILEILGRRIHRVVLTTALVFGIAAVTAWKLPDVYRTDTLILVDPQKVPEKYVSTTVSTDVSGRLNTISQQIMSSTRLKRIIDTYDLYRNLKGHSTEEEIIERMRSDIKVEVVRNFESSSRDGSGRGLAAFRITYQGRDPAMVAQVCSQLASLFIEENLKVREQQAEGTSEFLENQLTLARKNLEEQERKVRDFKLKHVGELPEQAAANIATLGRLQVQLQAETEALNRARQQELFLQAMLASTSRSLAPTVGGEPGPSASVPAQVPDSLARLRQQRASAEGVLQQWAARYSENHPDLKRQQALLESLDKQIRAEERRLSAAPPAAPLPVISRRPSAPLPEANDPQIVQRNQLRMIQAEIQNRQGEQGRISAQLRSYQYKVDQMPVREQQIADVLRDYEISRGFYQSLLEKKMSADVSTDLEKRQKSERFAILDPARVPEKPFKPNRPAIATLGFLFALALGVGLALLTEIRDPSVKKEEEVTSFGLRVLARIPPVVTADELLARRRRALRNWALSAAATVTALLVTGGLVGLITRWMF